MQALCLALYRQSGATWVGNCSVDALHYDMGWHLNHHLAPVLILANGYEAASYAQTKALPLKPVWGQFSVVKATHPSNGKIMLPLCREMALTPLSTDTYAVGSSYHLDSVWDKIEDDQVALQTWHQFPFDGHWQVESLYHWSQVRATTKDYLPIVGAVSDASLFQEAFRGLLADPHRFVANESPVYPGLYMLAGFGSRGLLSIPLAAEALAALINNEPSPVEESLLKSMAPSRFLL